jgi:hypothetical protein
MSEPADSSEGIRLKALKDKLRLHLAKNGGQAPKEYDTPEELADMVREDMIEQICEKFPDTEVYTELDQENDAHLSYGYSVTKLFVAERYFHPLVSMHLDGQGGALVIEGPDGSGKSALLAHFFQQHQRWPVEEEDTDSEEKGSSQSMALLSIVHHVGASHASRAYPNVIHRCMSIWKKELGIPKNLPASDSSQLVADFPEWIAAAATAGTQAGQKIVLALDGIQSFLSDKELRSEHLRSTHVEESSELNLSWLPVTFPSNFFLFVTLRREDERQYEILRDRQWPVQHLEPLPKSEIETFVTRYLTGLYRKTITENQMARILNSESPMIANPLFLTRYNRMHIFLTGTN